jgi:hypothetical protein
MACRVFRHLKSVMRTSESSSPANVVRPPLINIPLANRTGLSTGSVLYPPAGALAPHSVASVDVVVDSDAKLPTDDVLNVTFPQGAKLSPMRSV